MESAVCGCAPCLRCRSRRRRQRQRRRLWRACVAGRRPRWGARCARAGRLRCRLRRAPRLLRPRSRSWRRRRGVSVCVRAGGGAAHPERAPKKLLLAWALLRSADSACREMSCASICEGRARRGRRSTKREDRGEMGAHLGCDEMAHGVPRGGDVHRALAVVGYEHVDRPAPRDKGGSGRVHEVRSTAAPENRSTRIGVPV